MAKRGLWDNIHAKRKRIKAGSGERMRKPGSKGAPTAQDFKDASESVEIEEVYSVHVKGEDNSQKFKDHVKGWGGEHHYTSDKGVAYKFKKEYQANGFHAGIKTGFRHLDSENDGKMNEAKDSREYGFEGEMVMSQLKGIMAHAEQLNGMLKPDTDLPEWVQSKITLAYDYLQTAADYMATEVKEEMACNSVGAGKVAGLGVGPQGEPPVKKSKVLKRFSKFTGK